MTAYSFKMVIRVEHAHTAIGSETWIEAVVDLAA